MKCSADVTRTVTAGRQPPPTAPSVLVVIVNYETSEYVRRCVASLNEQDWPHEIVVVNNPSPMEDWRNLPAGVTVIRLQENVGYGRGCNAGVAAASASSEFVCILNPDTIVPREALGQWVQSYEKSRGGILAPLLLNENGVVQKSTYRFPGFWSYWHNHSVFAGLLKHVRKAAPAAVGLPGTRRLRRPLKEVDWVVGAAMLMNRRTWEEVEGFYPAYFLYAEDVDICYRVRKGGRPVALDESISIIHTQGDPDPEVRDVALLRLFTGIRTFLHLHYGIASRVSTKSAVIADMLFRIPVLALGYVLRRNSLLYRKRLSGCFDVLALYLRPPF